jgi:hypothetical protein
LTQLAILLFLLLFLGAAPGCTNRATPAAPPTWTPGAPVLVASAADGGGTQICADETGAADCCPAEAHAGGACSLSGITCWTRCRFASREADAGTRARLSCSDGVWVAGHGLFPCQRASGARPE